MRQDTDPGGNEVNPLAIVTAPITNRNHPMANGVHPISQTSSSGIVTMALGFIICFIMIGCTMANFATNQLIYPLYIVVRDQTVRI